MKSTARSGLPICLVAFIALSGCADVRVLSDFGSRATCEGGMRSSPHSGVDIFASYGEDVLAAAGGRVILAGQYPFRPATGANCGIAVQIEHSYGIAGMARTLYCHLSQTLVTKETEVKRGTVIGYIGTSGYTNPQGAQSQCLHVHFELLRGGSVDPLPFVEGCFDPKKTYADDRLVLTYPVRCGPSRWTRALTTSSILP